MTDTPPPTPSEGGPPPDDVSSPSKEELRQGFFTGALADTDRMLHLAQSMRLQMMLAGFEAMVLQEEAELGHPIRSADPAVRGFHLHQAQVLRVSTIAVQRQIEIAGTLRDRLPATAAVFAAGGCSQEVAAIVVDQVQDLDAAATAAVDAVAAELVGTERAGAVERELTELRDRLDPDGAVGRHRSASNRRWVGARPRRDGQGTLTIETTAADVAAIYDAIRQSAVAAHGREGECRTLGQLMADCAVDMILSAAQHDAVRSASIAADATTGESAAGAANGSGDGTGDGGPAMPMERLGDLRVPGRKKVQVTLLVTVPADVVTGAANGTASIAGMGTVDAEVALQIAQHTATWTRVLVDPVDDAVLGIDSHERYIPAGLKKLIHARNQTCSIGICGIPAHRTDLDHATRVEHDGRTRHDNLQALCRRHHQDKDGGYYDVTLHPDGTPRWASKWGAVWSPRPALKIRTTRTCPDDPPF